MTGSTLLLFVLDILDDFFLLENTLWGDIVHRKVDNKPLYPGDFKPYPGAKNGYKVLKM